MAKKARKPLIEKDFSQRIDGNVNVWERAMGKYGWTDWQIVKVLTQEKRKGKHHGSTSTS